MQKTRQGPDDDGGRQKRECIVERDDRGVAVITLLGEHDMVAADEVREAIHFAASETPVVVDLSKVDFIDSTVVNTLVRANNECNRPLVLQVATSRSVRRILEITGLTSVIPTADERDRAVGLALQARAHPAHD